MSETNYALSPYLVIWEATRACHLACAHCRAAAIKERHPEELTTNEGMTLMDQILEMGCHQLVITGGDPMVRPDLYELIAYGVEKGLNVSICPSATQFLTAEALRSLQEAGISRIALSVDGASSVTHDQFRGTEKTYDRTIAAIATIKQLGLPLQINTTVCRINKHELPAIAEQVAAWSAVLWSVFMLVPTGRGRNLDLLSPAEHEDVYLWLANLSTKVPFGIKTTEGQPYRRVLIQQRHKAGLTASPSNAAARRPSGIYDGKGFCFVSHRGEVCPSGFLELPGGNVRHRTLADIYRNAPLFRQLRDTDLLHGKCGVCEYRNVCGGSRARAFTITGDYMAADPTCIYEPVRAQQAVI